jgi:hypothetical protein
MLGYQIWASLFFILSPHCSGASTYASSIIIVVSSKNAKHFKELVKLGSSGQFPNLPYPIVWSHPRMRPHASWLFHQKMQSILKNLAN